MGPFKKELKVKTALWNFDKKQIQIAKAGKKFNHIQEWKAAGKFISKPRVVSVPESKLNCDQLSILNLIKKQCLLSDSDFFQNPLRLIISGAAGTGKSVVIEHILKFLEEENKKRKNCLV